MIEYRLVSVYWISAYRKDYLARSIESFLASTDYPRNRLELIVVDCSVGERGTETRQWLATNSALSQVVLRDRLYCSGNNGNKGFEVSHGDYIVQLEDDVIFSNETPKDWIENAIQLIQSGQTDLVDLWREGAQRRVSCPGFILSRNARQKWGDWPCYPNDFQTVAESQAVGDRKRDEQFRNKGLHCNKGFSYLRTSLDAPSINLSKLMARYGMSYEDAESLLEAHTRVIRIKDGGYISNQQYQAMRGWEACAFEPEKPTTQFRWLVLKARFFKRIRDSSYQALKAAVKTIPYARRMWYLIQKTRVNE